ncbi:MAG TPA: carboxypeptidase regulatory-like domain-containing protein [Terriglobales bacterium]|nr:carboxypeptidase regulatory-like domain-containing protein [Terriglobales bacterium]
MGLLRQFGSAAVFCAVFAAGVSAQSGAPASGLLVTAVDENGVAVAGVRVMLQASALPAALHCETDFGGDCRFPDLPAGPLQLRLQKEGFYEATVAEVHPGTVEVTLQRQQEVRELVNVVESPPAIDRSQVASQEKLTGLQIIDIPYPTTRDYRKVLGFIPTVVPDASGQPHVAGQETYETRTLLDGFDVTQPANGQLLVRVSTDAFRSIEVEPGREPAEYGKASGGVLALNTGIGDDHLRFSATDFTPSFQNKKGWTLDSVTPRFAVSGPMRKGKMWFYNAGDGEYDNIVIPELPNGVDTDGYWRVGDLLKLQTNLSARNIFTTSFVINHLRDEHDGLSPQNPAPATPVDAESAYAASAKDQYYFSGGELLETGFGFDRYDLGFTPLGSLPYFMAPGSNGGNYYLNASTQAEREQLLANLYLPAHQWHGRHDIKAGIDLDRLGYEARFTRQPISFLRSGQAPRAGQPLAADACLAPPAQGQASPCSRYSEFSGGAPSSTYNTEASAYAEDRWLISDRLLIEPGLRLDWDQIVRSALFSPRLAGTYVLDRRGETKLSAGIGTVYDATPIFVIARPLAGQRLDYFFDANGNALGAPVLTTFRANMNTLQAPRFLNWSAALERKLPASIYLKAEFMQDRGSHGFVYNTANGAADGNFLLQNSRNARYDAFTLSLRRNFAKGYSLFASYTRSRTRSNQALDFSVDNPVLSAQAAGPFPWDAPNRFLSWGYVPFFTLPWIHRLELAYSLEARTGFPYIAVNSRQQIVGPPDSHRFPGDFTLNLQLEKRFHLFGFYWAVRGGFDNITGHKNYLVVYNNVDSPQFGTFSVYEGRAFTSRIRFLGRK